MSIVRARAPLRLGLAGGGTDVSPYSEMYGGAALNATISRYAHTTIRPSVDGRVRFVALDQGIEESFAVGEAMRKDNRLMLHRGVYERLTRVYRGGEAEALTVLTACDAPAGSGLGSSSTLVVSMVRAFAELWSLPLGEYELAHLAYGIEREDVGLHGGKQDQYAAAFGGFNFMEFERDGHVLVNPLRVKEWIVSELELSLVLFFTGRSRASAAIIEEESRNVREKNTAAVEAMHQAKESAYRMKSALLRGQIEAMGDVMQEAWAQKKRMASSVSNTAIDGLYDLAMREGAFCGKISGAGGGGFMMFLVDPARRLRVEDALNATGCGRTEACHFTSQPAQAWRQPGTAKGVQGAHDGSEWLGGDCVGGRAWVTVGGGGGGGAAEADGAHL